MDERLRGDMSYLYETHMHTSEVSACAINSAAEQIKFYKKLGYTGVIVTDHFINGNSTCPQNYSWEKKMNHIMKGFIEAKKAGIRHDVDVFFGWEYTIRGTDLLTYGLGLDFLVENTDLAHLSVEQYSLRVRKNGGFLAQAHPFRNAFYIANPHPVAPYLIDAVEVYNASDSSESNSKAREFAKVNNLPMQAGSDSHRTNSYGYSGIKLKERASTIQDIIEAIKTNNAELI